MENNILKLADGLHFDFDPEIELDIHPVHESHDTLYNRTSVDILNNMGPCWQYFSNGRIYFFRNLHPYYGEFCSTVVSTIKKIQMEYSTSTDERYKKFLDYEIISSRVTVLKMPFGITVPAHTDVTRTHSINIGLKNSNVAETLFHYSDGSKDRYTMADGDMYFLNTGIMHSVSPLVPQSPKKFRYLITYSCS